MLFEPPNPRPHFGYKLKIADTKFKISIKSSTWSLLLLCATFGKKVLKKNIALVLILKGTLLRSKRLII
jgi:hypothetical protein